MKCANPNCDEDIRRGERHVTVNRHIEVETSGNLIERALGRRDVVTVEDAELVAAYHLRCAPPKNPTA